MRDVGAIILAAGSSSRLGQPKQLLRIAGETFVRRAVAAAFHGGCAPLIVVAGTMRAEIEAELSGTLAIVIENPDWARGLGTSIKRGIAYLLNAHAATDAVVLLVCDQPHINAAVVEALIAEHGKGRKPIVASSYAATVGVPALFHRSCFEALLTLRDDSGAKPVIESRRSDVVTIQFEGGAIDIDTPDDLGRLKG